MKITAKVVDHKKIIISLKELPGNLMDALMDELYIGVNEIRNYIIRSMEDTKRAPWFYWRGKGAGRKKHHPSMPFNPPARDTGELISRIIADVRSDEAEVGVEAGAPYSIYLEKGTPKMKKRPFLEPAIDAKLPEMEENIMAAIEQAAEDTFRR